MSFTCKTSLLAQEMPLQRIRQDLATMFCPNLIAVQDGENHAGCNGTNAEWRLVKIIFQI